MILLSILTGAKHLKAHRGGKNRLSFEQRVNLSVSIILFYHLHTLHVRMKAKDMVDDISARQILPMSSKSARFGRFIAIFKKSPINLNISKKIVQFVVFFPKISQVGEKSLILSRFVSPINCEIISR